MRILVRGFIILVLCLPLGGCINLIALVACAAGIEDACDELFYGPGGGPELKLLKGLVEGDARLLANLTSSPCTNLGDGSYRCEFGGIAPGLVSTFTVDGGEISDKHALIVQMPLNASDFKGQWDRMDFDFSTLEISDRLLQVPVDHTRSLLAEPGTQLLVIDGDFAEVPFGAVRFVVDFAPNQAAPIDFKVLQAAVVKVGDKRFYAPILPCSTDMADAIAFSMPASQGAELPIPTSIPNPCDGDTYTYFQNSKNFRVQGCMSGSWSDENFNGQGFLIEVLDAGLVVVYWFSYDDTGKPVWFFGVGQIDGTTITVTMLYDTDGPIFGPGWNLADFVPFEWGTLTLEFTRYNRGTATFVSLFPGMFPSHVMDIRRLTSLWGPPCEPSELELAVN